MRFQRIIEQVYFRPWYITPAAHASLHRVVSSKLFGRAEDSGDDMGFGDFINQRDAMKLEADGIATIHILGPLGKNLSKLEKACGCTSFEDIRDDYAKAIGSGARGILLRFDSPGGTVTGTPEVAALIASRPLPTVAYSEDTMASAAYYLAAGANAIVGTGSSYIGSIGVYIPWVDYIEQLKLMGLQPNPIVSGDLKAIGFTGVLTDAQRAYWQEMVDEEFGQFVSHVRSFRSIPDEALRGQAMDGRIAFQMNLLDAIGDFGVARSKLLSLL